MSYDAFDSHTLALAEKVLAFSRKRVTASAPYLLEAIYALRQRPRREMGPMSTDGIHVDFCPDTVLEDFRRDKDEPARQLLHVTLHCLLGHLDSRREAEQKAVFDALADGKIERFARIAAGLGSPHCDNQTHFHIVHDIPYYALFPNSFLHSTLAVQYRKLSQCSDSEHTGLVLAEWENYEVDDHDLWEKGPPSLLRPFPGAGAGGRPNWRKMLENLCGGMLGKLPGELAGALQLEFAPAEENGVTYADFLRRFARSTERLHTDPDSIDPKWYHLGLELYGDIPILEPCEMSEPPRPDELVIALDTSGSCSGEVCRRFLRETLNLLGDVTAGSSAFRLLLLQCDTKIHRELFLESREQADRLAEDFAPQGFGGTDFAPVFRRVEELRQTDALPRVRGLLYLSDGFGHFPQEAPDYPVIFLVPRESENDGVVENMIPPWVTVLILDEHNYTVKEAAS